MTALIDHLGQVGARLRPGTGGFLRWWGHALASWLPLRWRQALGVDRGRLLLQVDGDAVQLRLHQTGQLRDLGHVPLPAGPAPGPGPTDADLEPGAGDPLARLLSPRVAELPRWLLLPAASALRRRLALPAAAAERLREVVAFEIERQTPFSADAVAFDARLLARHDREGRIEAELVAVPRRQLDPQLAALGPLAATLAGIDVAGNDGAPLAVNLLPPAQRRHHGDPWRHWNRALAVLALVLVAALLWQLLDNRREAADALEQAIAADAQAGRRAAAQRQQLRALIEGQAFLDRARATRPTAVEIIDELTRRLPDHTYLEKLSIDDERMMLIGLSSQAPALIERLQGSELWESPALAGALQPDPGSGRDRFTLVAQLESAPPEPAPPGQAGREPARTDEEAADGDAQPR